MFLLTFVFCTQKGSGKGAKPENPLQYGTRRDFGPHESRKACVFPLMFTKMWIYFSFLIHFFLR